MTVHLDTYQLIALKQEGSVAATRLRQWRAAGILVRTSSIAWSEFLCGPPDPGEQQAARALIGEPEPFLEAEAELAGELFNHGGRRARSLADCQIAATAMRAGAALATADRAAFARFTALGLRLAN